MRLLYGATNNRTAFLHIKLCTSYTIARILENNNYLTEYSIPKTILYSALTPAEKKIARIIAKGMNYCEISDLTGLKYKTYITHKRNIMQKFRVISFSELYMKCKILFHDFN